MNGALRGIYAKLGYQRVCHQPQTYDSPPVRYVSPIDCDAIKPFNRSLRWHTDARGALVELHRNSWDHTGMDHVKQPPVQQVYISMTRKGVVKGWHAHAKQTDRFTCIRGAVMVAVCDLRPLLLSSTTPTISIETIVLDSNLSMEQLTIPPGVVHGWKALTDDARVLNVCSHEYDGTDEYRIPPERSPLIGWDREVHVCHSLLSFDWQRDPSG